MIRACVLVAMLSATSACSINSALVDCPGLDLSCPLGDTCDVVHGRCISADQQQACIGMADLAACRANETDGYCRDQVCLFPVCGDGYLDPGEACDDGNHTSGDGCDATCASAEVCGNGILDAAHGEACDDGNVVSGDGCDSQCRIEQLTVSIDGIVPRNNPYTGHLAFDGARRQLVMVSDGLVWRWDGTQWSMIPGEGPPHVGWSEFWIVYDPDRETIVLVGQDQATPELWEWDGSSWTAHVPINSPPDLRGVVYDRARHMVLATGLVGSSMGLWSLDVASSTWTQLASPPASTSSFALAYDDARAVTVMLSKSSASPDIYEWNGTAWSGALATTLPTLGQWSMAYDPQLGGVFVMGDTSSKSVWKWDGATTTVLPAQALPAIQTGSSIAYDPDRDRLVVYGGGGTNSLEVLEWNGSVWIVSAIPGPYDLLAAAWDSKRSRLVVLAQFQAQAIHTWTWDGTWHQLAPAVGTVGVMVYDPVRDAVVYEDGNRTTWVFHNDVWTQLETLTTTFGMIAVAYDPIRGGIVGTDGLDTWFLASSAPHWTKIAGVPPVTFRSSFAFDPRQNVIFDSTGTGSFELGAGGMVWGQTLAPYGYSVIEDTRRGTIDFVAPTDKTWERIGGEWLERPPVPWPVNGLTVYASNTGELITIGSIAYTNVMIRAKYVGTSPLETCSDGADDDGDGLAGCADPDCWWMCAPACPPYVSCP